MTNSVIKICNFVHYFFREGGYLDWDQFSLLLFSLFMGGGRVKREIVPNSLFSLFFYFELFPKDGRSTLIGIVSGGIGCGDGFPSWYTKVSFYKDWISCIIEKSLEFDYNQKKVENECNKIAFKRSIHEEDRIYTKGECDDEIDIN